MKVISILLVLSLFFSGYECSSLETVHMRDIQTLTLRKGKMTESYESSPILQLNCEYGCEEVIPDVMNCRNMGYDGKEYQWKCESIMPSNYEIYNNHVTISCERNKEMGGHYVYAGTCGAFFALKKLDNEKQKTKTTTKTEKTHNFNYDYQYDNFDSEGTGIGVVFFIVIAVFMLILICSCLCRVKSGGRNRRHYQGSDVPPRNDYVPGGVNPEYTRTENIYPDAPVYRETTTAHTMPSHTHTHTTHHHHHHHQDRGYVSGFMSGVSAARVNRPARVYTAPKTKTTTTTTTTTKKSSPEPVKRTAFGGTKYR